MINPLMEVRQGGKETGRSALFFSTDTLLPSVVSEPSYTTVSVVRKDTAQCFPGERSNCELLRLLRA